MSTTSHNNIPSSLNNTHPLTTIYHPLQAAIVQMDQIIVAYTFTNKETARFASLTETANTWIGSGPNGQRISICMVPLFEPNNPKELSSTLKNGPIHVILHKTTGHMALCMYDGNHQAIQRMTTFEDAVRSKLQYICGKPQSFIMLDPLECVWRVIDRRQMYQAIDNAFGRPEAITPPNHRYSSPNSRRPHILSAFKTLPWVDVPLDRGIQAVGRAVEGKLTFPVILKTRVACGSTSSHEMAVVSDMDGLIAAAKTIFGVGEPGVNDFRSHKGAPDPAHVGTYRSDAVAQEFRTHTDGLIFKGYMIGSKLNVQARSGVSFKDISSTKGSTYYFHSQKKCAMEVPGFDSVTGCSRNTESIKPPLELCKAVATALKKQFGLSLMGFDILYDIRFKTYYVVDINFFPSYKGWNTAVTNGYLLQHICDSVLERRNQ